MSFAWVILIVGIACFVIAAFSPQPESERRVTFTPAPRRSPSNAPHWSTWLRRWRPTSPAGAATSKPLPAAPPSGFATDASVATIVRTEPVQPSRRRRASALPAAIVPLDASAATVIVPPDRAVDVPAAPASTEVTSTTPLTSEEDASEPWWGTLVDREPSNIEKIRMITTLGALQQAWCRPILEAAQRAENVPAIADAIRIAMRDLGLVRSVPGKPEPLGAGARLPEERADVAEAFGDT